MKHHYAQMLRVLLGFVISSTLTILPVSFTGPDQAAVALACLAAASRWPIGWRASRRRTKKPADAKRTAPPLRKWERRRLIPPRFSAAQPIQLRNRSAGLY